MTKASETIPVLSQLQDWLLRSAPPSGARRVLPLLAALASDVGAVRKENQDRVALARGRDRGGQSYAVAALADGIGGMRGGAECAALAVAAALDAVQLSARSGAAVGDWVTSAINSAQDEVRKAFKGVGGATLVVVVISEFEGACWASVGDSRLYASHSGDLVQLSTDDTIAGQLGRQSDSDIDQNKLLQFIGMNGELEFSVTGILSTVGTVLLLASDGIHFLGNSSDVMAQVIKHSPDLGATVRRLTELARWAGGPDNASLAAIPLEIDRFEPPSVHPCLDIWDPYGEIRIPLQPLNITAQPAASSQQHHASAELVASKGNPETLLDYPEPSVAPTKQTKSKEKSQKLDASLKPKKKRKPRVPRTSGAPQVQLEFSNKKT